MALPRAVYFSNLVTMEHQYHILNGDALKEQFPENLEGEVIVARECLVTGNVQGEPLRDFFELRAKFISESYEGESIITEQACPPDQAGSQGTN